MNIKINKLILAIFLLFSVNSFSQVKLPKLVSDGMVIQRGVNVKIWGWAANDEKVSVHFLNSTYNTVADSKGDWSITLPKMEAGGPYEMDIKASNSITIHDIMVGDVWVCSGQSNMELPMSRVSWNYPGEIANSENKYIRQFYVPQTYNFQHPQNDLSYRNMPAELIGWKIASPENTPFFSAVAYFFGKELYEKYKVPVGLINSSLGGSPIESWISANALKKFPQYYNEAQMFKDSILIHKIEAADNARINAWNNELWKVDEGNKDPLHMWFDPSLNTSNWDSMKVPGYWADETKLGLVNGVVWFRKNVIIPSSLAGKPAELILGRIVDADSAYVNGVFVGTISYQYPPSRFNIPAGLLKEGENSIVVRVISNAGKGGFVPDKLYAIVSDKDTVNIAGQWKYRLGAVMPPLASQTFIRWMPIGLYNAMIAPLLNYRIKGVIWYQGESNADRPKEYNSLMETLIQDWREKWNEGDFPFLFVQLPNFMEPKNEPSESNWALIREAQLKTLSVPNTGMAVTYDIGEWNDIHPLDKKDVGYRLFLAAEKVAYGDNKVVYSGPIYKSMKIEGNKIILSFTNVGNGLVVKGNADKIQMKYPLKYFSIAGADKKFVWANAKIDGDKVVVWSSKISNPVAVRYAWADDPEGANLYNKEGLPASPFRTDDWTNK
jgi:sialate O-acetylesterase